MSDARLLVEVAADAAKFYKTMDRVVRESESVRTQAMQMAKTSAAAIAAIGVTSAAAVTTMAVQASNDMRELVREAELLGTTAGSLSEWEYAGRSMGLEVGKVRDIFKDLNDKVGDFARTGGGEAADVFEQLGLEAREFIGLAPEQAILRIGDALEGLSQSEKTFFLESIADDASRLIPLLDDNASAFKTLAEEGRNFGTVVTSEQAEVASGFADLLKDATNMAGGFKTQLGIGLAPTFEGILSYLEEVTEGFGGPKEAAEVTARAIVGAMRDSVKGVQTLMGGLEDAYDFYLSIRQLEAQFKAVGGTINNMLEGDDTLPDGFMDMQRIQAERDKLASGQGFGSDAVTSLDNLLEHMERANTDAMPQLNDTAVRAATNIGILANSVKDTAESMVTTRNNLVQQMTGAGVVPTGSQGAVPERAGSPSAGLNLRSITPMSADQVGGGGPASAALSGSAPKSRGSVHVTVTKDGSSVSGEVEGDDEFIKRLAGALSSTASSV